MAYRYPIMLDMRDRQVVIVGGGAVAARKARRLLQAGARRVRVISPAFDPTMPDEVERVAALYSSSHLAGAELTFAATNSTEVNDAVVRDARRFGIWVNRADADDELAGDFAVPASYEDGPVIVSVRCGSPALSRRIRDVIQSTIDPRWGQFADVLERLRPIVREDPRLSPDKRREVLIGLSGDAAFEAFSRGGVEGLIRFVQSVCPDWKSEGIS